VGTYTSTQRESRKRAWPKLGFIECEALHNVQIADSQRPLTTPPWLKVRMAEPQALNYRQQSTINTHGKALLDSKIKQDGHAFTADSPESSRRQPSYSHGQRMGSSAVRCPIIVSPPLACPILASLVCLREVCSFLSRVASCVDTCLVSRRLLSATIPKWTVLATTIRLIG
jgi:hypothetical protein